MPSGDDANERYEPRPGNVLRPDPDAVAARTRATSTPIDPAVPEAEPAPSDPEPSGSPRRGRRRSRRRTALLLIAALATVLLITVVLVWAPWQRDSVADNPFEGAEFYVDPDAQAQQAADGDADSTDAAILDRLAAVPTGIWLVPEEHGRGEVGEYVRAVESAAGDQVAVFVIYGIPDRDCGGQQSSGGLSAADYPAWVGEIAAAVATGPGVVVLEPDALAGSFDCADVTDERVDLISGAIGSLTDAGVPTYVDAGHSEWRSVADMADLLQRVGVDRVRGFSTNVSAYEPDAAEQAYAEQLSGELDGAHYVIDSGRNGEPEPAVGDWCNPEPVGGFGTMPAVVNDSSAQDAWLWIKPPGESDGSGGACGDAPPAGEFWPERALEMAEASGWS